MSEEQESRESKEKADNKQGIFITKGMQVTIPEGGLTLQIGPDGKPQAELKSLHLELDLCLYWLEIAVDHLVSAEQANAAVLAARKSGDSKQKAEALEAEFTSRMQAIAASAIAIDAFYAAIKERAAIPNIDELSRTWREKGTARYKQIAEVMRRAFSLRPEPFRALRSNLKELMNYRGKAVHPPSGATKPMMHPELNQPTEWWHALDGNRLISQTPLLAEFPFLFFPLSRAREGSTVPAYPLAHHHRRLWPPSVSSIYTVLAKAGAVGSTNYREGKVSRRYAMRATLLVSCLATALILLPQDVFAQRPPVIDVHLHAYTEVPPEASASWTGEPEARALPGAMSAEEHRKATLAEMDRYNVVLGVVSGPEKAVRAWHEAAPDRFTGGAFLGAGGMPEHTVDSLRSLIEKGVFGVLGELGLQYQGISPDDSRLEPYYAVAEELSVPVALHTGLGPPGGPHSFAPKFRVTLGRPTLFEPVLARHPHLKAYLMHAGWPYITETIAMMYIYPDLYADVGVLAWALPRAAFYDALQQLVNAGFGDRLLFGTDQMFWPGALGLAIETVEAVPFLSEDQKRDLLYHNAARFLELIDEEIARHHGE